MIVVGIDRDAGLQLPRVDLQEIGALLHLRAELAQLRRHRREAVGLLQAPAADVADRAGTVGKEREHRGGHGGIGDVVHIHVDRLQFRRPSPRSSSLPIETCAPMRSSTSVKRTSPWMLERPRPRRAPGRRRAHRLRGSTTPRKRRLRRRFPGARIRHCRHVESASRWAPLHAEAPHRVQRDLDIGLRMSSPSISTRAARRESGSAIRDR